MAFSSVALVLSKARPRRRSFLLAGLLWTLKRPKIFYLLVFGLDEKRGHAFKRRAFENRFLVRISSKWFWNHEKVSKMLFGLSPKSIWKWNNFDMSACGFQTFTMQNLHRMKSCLTVWTETELWTKQSLENIGLNGFYHLLVTWRIDGHF